ncbi:uncharacterized protein LOC116349704 [Contarinia nasturtii]|uniref:uncharacterized protein LOC116349704 n=1 Tax=Contarinia nasturtii TaxID=265458 RepID=UPI0012D495FF|nr:uncharacterized protein LOC116349704 [Contarinia nasturtii]
MKYLLVIVLVFGASHAQYEDINVNARDEQLNTPLHNAASRGYYLSRAKLLIKHGANLNAKNINKETPLHLAVRYDKPDIVKLLVESGASVNPTLNTMETPLHLAVKMNKADIVKILVDHGADVSAKDNTERTPIFWAAEYRNEHIARILIENRVNNRGAVDLLLAVVLGKEDVVKNMAETGADVNAEMYDKRRPLHLASFNGINNIVKYLISYGADVNAKNVYGDTPLHEAARLGSTNIVKFLVENGADLFAKNNRGQTPRELVLWISETPNEKYHEHMWIATILQNAEEHQKQMEKFKRPEKHRCLFGVID